MIGQVVQRHVTRWGKQGGHCRWQCVSLGADHREMCCDLPSPEGNEACREELFRC